ncbi:MAG TPA: hypothetical protein ENK85_04855, partial [Saprospiraceae bacterium]|nr:hypothetical protein [Saprospiraceae bacterium]
MIISNANHYKLKDLFIIAKEKFPDQLVYIRDEAAYIDFGKFKFYATINRQNEIIIKWLSNQMVKVGNQGLSNIAALLITSTIFAITRVLGNLQMSFIMAFAFVLLQSMLKGKPKLKRKDPTPEELEQIEGVVQDMADY